MADLVSVGAHPGYAARPGWSRTGRRRATRLLGAVFRAGTVLVGQSARTGALPQLRAATDPAVTGAVTTSGPRLLGWRGLPVRAPRSAAARDDGVQARALWPSPSASPACGFDGCLDAASRPA